MDSQTKLKRVVIKEELVNLTGNHIKALILNQFLYWGERTKDFDRFIQEEKGRYFPEDKDLNIDPTFGWIYKTAEELSEELMLGVSASTIRRHLSKLVKDGYINQRHNPNHKWDRTLQYRPDIIAIQTDLESMGYSLEGYPLLQNAFSKMKNGISKIENQSDENERAIPETTTETTTDISPSAENVQTSGTPEILAVGENSNIQIQPKDKKTIPPDEVNAILHEGGYDPDEVGAKIQIAAEQALAKVKPDGTEPDALTETFGPNRRQDQQETSQLQPKINGKLTEADQAHLRTFGYLPGDKPPEAFDTIQELRQAGWEIWDPTTEQGIAYCLEAIRTKKLNFAVPNNTRKDWHKDVKGHLQDYRVDDLRGLYRLAVDKLEKAGMSYTRPGSLTKTLPDVVNEPTPKTIIDKDGGFYV